MDERRKAAYRYLLHNFCLELRLVSPYGATAFDALRDLLWRNIKRQRAHHAFHLADAFHNLAYFSAKDFDGFDEEQFWNLDIRILNRFRKNGYDDFRAVFDDYLEIKR